MAGWAHELKQLAKAGSKAVETALVATAENKDPETVWNAYSAASAALLNTGVFPTVPGGGTMAKAGTVRIRPFVENVLSIGGVHQCCRAARPAPGFGRPDRFGCAGRRDHFGAGRISGRAAEHPAQAL